MLKENYFCGNRASNTQVGCFHTKESSSSHQTPAGCPQNQFTSERIPEFVHMWRREPSPLGLPPHHHQSQARHGSPTLLSKPQMEHLQRPPPRTQETCDLSIVHKGVNSQRGRQKARSGGGPTGWSFCLRVWGAAPSQLWSPQPRSSLNQYCREVPLGKTD